MRAETTCLTICVTLLFVIIRKACLVLAGLSKLEFGTLSPGGDGLG